MKFLFDFWDHSKVGVAGWSRRETLVGSDDLGEFDKKDGQEEDYNC